MIRAAIFDLDGTLLNAQHILSSATRAALAALQERGVSVILASGRSELSMRPYYEQLELTTPLICYNGAKIIYPHGEVIERPLDVELTRELVLFAREHDVHLNLYLEERWHTERPESPEALRYAEITKLKPHGESLDTVRGEAATKALIISTPERLVILRQLLEERFGVRVGLTSAMTYFLEILNPAVNKGEAVRQVMTRADINLTDVIAFGDGLNDLEMISAVGWGVAMENGRAALRAVARDVGPHHHPHGVADYLAQHFGLELELNQQSSKCSE